MISYVDTHSHLAMLNHSPLEEILMRAKLAGITKMVSVSTDEGSWESNRNLAATLPHVWYSIGLHPHDAIRWPECAGHMMSLFKDDVVPKKCVAIGEMGMDFHYEYSPKETQIDVFESQLELAKRVNLPIIIHCRDAFDELYGSIRKVGLSTRGGVMHCFTGDAERAKQAVDLGLKISFSGILTFKNAKDIQGAAKILPLTEVVLETDCPFLAPIPLRGKANEPSFLPHTAQFLANLVGKPVAEIAEATSRNAVELFKLNG